MNPLTTIAALALAAFGLMAFACWRARRRALRVAELEKPRDWREEWCCPECYADHRQQGPCLDCAARRAARWAR